MDRVVLRQFSAWMGFVVIITIISGVFSVLLGLFTFTVGAIPGIIAIILGVKLHNARQYANAMPALAPGADYTAHFNMFAASLNTYFKLQGILIIVVMVFIIVIMVMAALFGIAFFSSWN